MPQYAGLQFWGEKVIGLGNPYGCIDAINIKLNIRRTVIGSNSIVMPVKVPVEL